ncbi:MAG: hypothetical protein NTZ38_00295 [Candidatus Taylorbacteria bacterium]|nr:hypothetical protein [Candidatus Taylorbacteria bacterium]
MIPQAIEVAIQIFDAIVNAIKSSIGILVGISIPVSAFFLVALVYCVERLKQIRSKEEEMYDLKVVPAYEATPAADIAMAKRWDSVKQHIDSKNPNDWRQAIMEADIILDDLLNKMGYRGESVGEKLKRVAKGDFKSLDDAWEAHKVRNQIAHEGSSFALNEHEAKQAVGRYKRVFEEFYYV